MVGSGGVGGGDVGRVCDGGAGEIVGVLEGSRGVAEGEDEEQSSYKMCSRVEDEELKCGD